MRIYYVIARDENEVSESFHFIYLENAELELEGLKDSRFKIFKITIEEMKDAEG